MSRYISGEHYHTCEKCDKFYENEPEYLVATVCGETWTTAVLTGYKKLPCPECGYIKRYGVVSY